MQRPRRELPELNGHPRDVDDGHGGCRFGLDGGESQVVHGRMEDGDRADAAVSAPTIICFQRLYPKFIEVSDLHTLILFATMNEI